MTHAMLSPHPTKHRQDIASAVTARYGMKGTAWLPRAHPAFGPRRTRLPFSNHDTQSPTVRVGASGIRNADERGRVLLLGGGLRTARAAAVAVDGRSPRHRRIFHRCLFV